MDLSSPIIPQGPPSLPELVLKLLDRLDEVLVHLQHQSTQLGNLLAERGEDGVTLAEDLRRRLNSLDANIEGFTNSGASFGAYQVDQFTVAYLNLLGPLLAVRLQKELGSRSIGELMKAAAPITRDALEELAAYREQQQGKDLLANTIGTMGDPWQNVTPEPDTDWQDLN